MGDFVSTIIDSVCSSMSGSLLEAEDLMFSRDYAGIANSIWGWFAIIAYGMTVIYFLFELNQRVTNEGRDFTIKSFLGPFIKLVIAIVIIRTGPGIASKFIEVGNAIILQAKDLDMLNIADATIEHNSMDYLEHVCRPGDGPIASTLKDLASKTAFFEKLFLVLVMFLSWILTSVLTLVWAYKTIAYKIEFIFRVGVAPIALADCYNGFHSSALKYLKSILAMGVYGASFLVIPKIGNVLLISLVSDMARDRLGFSGDLYDATGSAIISSMAAIPGATPATVWDVVAVLVSALVIPFAELGALSLCKQVSKEVLS